jgi:hypothetical protein
LKKIENMASETLERLGKKNTNKKVVIKPEI